MMTEEEKKIVREYSIECWSHSAQCNRIMKMDIHSSLKEWIKERNEYFEGILRENPMDACLDKEDNRYLEWQGVEFVQYAWLRSHELGGLSDRLYDYYLECRTAFFARWGKEEVMEDESEIDSREHSRFVELSSWETYNV
jgi:hypothetical protein